MAQPSVVLEQLVPAATTLTDVYTVPSGRRASVNILVSAQVSSNVTVRLRKSGTSDTNANFLSYAKVIAAATNESIPTSSAIILMSAGDAIAIYASNATVGITVNGYEDDIPT